ncbi:uncharacterized protein LOC144343122 [Saccoglossus kowalevskii]
MRCLHRPLGITWEDRITNREVLSKAKTTSIFAMLSQRRLRWLGHVSHIDKGRLTKDLLYGQLEEGTRPVGRPCLRFSDVCKRDFKATHIDTQSWEITADDCSAWRQTVSRGIHGAEEDIHERQRQKRLRSKVSTSSLNN